MNIPLDEIQQALRAAGIDGWLLYDFRGSNPLARRVLNCPADAISTRRMYCCIPAHGPPRKLVHRIESGALDHVPGDTTVYLTWQELEAGVARLVAGLPKLAMEYSPRNANPYLAKVDAGTVELVRELGANVVGSGDLIQLFEAAWTERQWQQHLEATRHTTAAFDLAWGLIARTVRDGGSLCETAVQRAIMEHFAAHRLVTDHPPIVAVGPHSGDPHYAPGPGHDAEIRAGDFVLIDLWAKCDEPAAVYSDLTRVGYLGTETPARYEEVFQVVAAARDAALDLVRRSFASGTALAGWQVDRAAREVIDRAGHGARFIHRTGHSLGEMTHGNGANMDDLETHDERLVLPRCGFTIEPGIYLPEFGVRSEVDVYVDPQRQVHVTGGPLQTRVLNVLAE